jgi:type IV pilus assembly protein PilY1
MNPGIDVKMRGSWQLLIFAFGICCPAYPAWASGFQPVSQCFRDTGAPGWVMQLYNNGTANTTIPLTAASNIDPAGSGWLRLTDNTTNQSGSAYYNLPINVTTLGIQAQFSYTSWGGSGADGISLYLFDGSTTNANFVQGVFGGGLGYCQQTNYGQTCTTSTRHGTTTTTCSGGTTLNGLSNAVLGLGIDDWGNYENDVDRCPNYGENGRKNTPYGSIGVRGPGNGQNGYNWLADNISLPVSTPTWYGTSTSTRPAASQFFRNVIVNISPTTPGVTTSYTVNASWETAQGGPYTSLLSAPYPTGNTPPYNQNNGKFFTLPATVGDAWTPLPPTVKFGFGASTGGATNYHEIQDAYFTEGLPDMGITQNVASASGGFGTFLVTVTNLGSTTAANAKFSATLTGLNNPLWSCTPSGGSSCPTSGVGAPSNILFSLGTVGNVTFTIKGTVAGTSISDSVSVSGPAGFNDADLASNSSASSLTIGSSPTNLNLAQLPQTTNSAADNTIKGGQVNTDTQVYVAQYHPANWWGELLAYPLLASGTNLSLGSTPNWDASCVLTGGSCLLTGATSGTAQSPGSRSILTWNGASGIPFVWNSLSASQQSALNADPVLAGTSPALTGSDVVDYLRGIRTGEQGAATPGPFRTRTGILGDIVNATPVFVGQPIANYPVTAPWADLLYTAATMPENAVANSYAAYKAAQATRTNVTYIAGNDGMLHGFSSGNFNSSGAYNTATNTGVELLAYIPGTVLTAIAQNSATAFATNYNFTDPAYTHHFFVDATPATGDLYYNNAWHTWLVGGLGGGGQAIYALDITNPANFSQSNAASLVVKELNLNNLTCSNNASCVNDLGFTYGTPIIQRMHNGSWAVIFGNGYNSVNGTAAVFIATIDSNNGAWTVYELQAGNQIPNGINYVTSADLDGDLVTDYLYAGDLFGNVWRFDVTSNNPANWAASKFGGASAQPLFTAVNANGVLQPISTSVVVQTSLWQGVSRILIDFGTGKNLEASDLLPDNTANGVQSLYGIWDWDMTAWNGLSSKSYATLSAPQTISRNMLQQQTVTGVYDGGGNAFTSASTTGYRTISGNTVCWQNSVTCGSGNNQFGYYLDLPSLGEQVIYSPIATDGLFLVNTTIPSAQTQGLTCYPPTPPGGWTMALNPLNGGATTGGSAFADSSGKFSQINSQNVNGMFVSAVGTPIPISYNSNSYIMNKTSNGTVAIQQLNSAANNPLPTNNNGRRISWIELR